MVDHSDNHFTLANKVTWKETEEGNNIPSVNYDQSINENEGEALNSIEWKKVKIVKRNLNKTKIEALKTGEIAYHRDYGYVKLERFLGNRNQNNLDSSHYWECSIIKSPYMKE